MNQTSQKPVGAVLVVGGGIGGIQTSLDLAESGLKVYLLEKNLSIGGTMARGADTSSLARAESQRSWVDTLGGLAQVA